jgi:hypothetical protein
MYQARVSNIVVPTESKVPADVDEAMWKVFGSLWPTELT